MAVSENTGGDHLIGTLDTEEVLFAAVTTAGVFVLAVETNALANDETLTLKIKTKLRTGDTTYLAYQAVFRHAQGEPQKYSVPVPSPFSIEGTIEQNGGTKRTFAWSLYEL